MIFKSKCSGASDKAFEALGFLRKMVREGRLNEITNMEDVIEALDISQDLENANRKLKEYHIDL